MANLSVTLELDNRGYITGIKASEDAIKKFGQTSQTATDQAARGMDRVNNNSQLLAKNFDRLRNAVIGAAFVSFARSALLASDRISDLSDATGIGIEKLLEYERAIMNSGLSADVTGQALTRFYQSISDGLKVGSDTQKNFEKLKVSLEELETLSEAALFEKAIKGLAGVTDKATRSKIILDLFGKSLAQLAPAKFAEELEKVRGKFEGQAQAIKDADQLVQDLQNTVRDLQIAFAEAFNPIIKAISWLIQNLPAANVLMKILLGLVVAIAVASGLRLLVSFIGAAYRGAVLLAGALKNIGSIGQGIKKFFGVGAETGIVAGRQAARQRSDVAAAIGIGGVAAGAGAFSIFGGEEMPTVTATPVPDLNENAGRQRDNGNAAERLASRLDNLRDKVADISKSYAQYSDELRSNNDLAVASLGLSENEIELNSKIADVRNRAADSIRDYVTIFENLKADEQGLKPIIIAQIQAIQERAVADEDSVRRSVTAVQDYKESLEKLADAAEMQNLRLANEESLQSLQEEIDLVGLYGDALEDQQAIVKVTQELRSKLLGIQQEENDLIAKKNTLSKEAFQREMARLKALREEAYVYAEERLRLEEELIAKQRELSQDWQKELSKQLEDLADSISPAKMAANMFGSVISSIDNALTEFVNKGKFSFKDFARSLLRDMALIIARAAIMRAILAAFGMAGFGPLASAGASSTMAFNYTGPQFGGFAANGAKVSPGKAYLVGERGPELFMPRSIGNVIPNNQLGGMSAPSQTQVTYNINAVDAASFRSMVARDPQFIFNVTEVGRRSSPARRLA